MPLEHAPKPLDKRGAGYRELMKKALTRKLLCSCTLPPPGAAGLGWERRDEKNKEGDGGRSTEGKARRSETSRQTASDGSLRVPLGGSRRQICRGYFDKVRNVGHWPRLPISRRL